MERDDATTRNGYKRRVTLESELAELGILSRRPLWGMISFLGASILAYYGRDLTLLPNLPSWVAGLMGDMPPLFLINTIFAVSTLSSIIVIVGKLQRGSSPGRTWPQLFFPTTFYLIYFAAGSLNLYFHAILTAGLTVSIMHHYQVSRYVTTALEMKQIRLQRRVWSGSS